MLLYLLLYTVINITLSYKHSKIFHIFTAKNMCTMTERWTFLQLY